MTDQAAPQSLDNLSPEDRAKFTVALLNRHLGTELRRLLLDDEFLLEFGPKLRRAMEGRALVEAHELEAEITEEAISEHSFRVFAERNDHPTNPGALYAFAQGAEEPSDISEEHEALIRNAMEEKGVEFGTYHWVTFRRKGFEEAQQATEESEDVGRTEQG